MVTSTKKPVETATERLYKSIEGYVGHELFYMAANQFLYEDTVKEFLGMVSPEEVILDAGCGPGRDLKRFAEAGYSAKGVDLNVKFLREAGKYAPAYYADILRLPFEDHSFGALWANASLVHMDPSLAREALAELLRVLKPGSPCFFSVATDPYGAAASRWQVSGSGNRYFSYWEYTHFPYNLELYGFDVSEYWIDGTYLDVYAYAKNK